MVYNNARGQIVAHLDLYLEGRKWVPAKKPVVKRAFKDTVTPDPKIESMVAKLRKLRKDFYAELNRKRYFEHLKKNPPNMFLGDKGCVRCHSQIWQQWRKSKHASAWESLERKKREDDGVCQRCHVTGMKVANTVGGFRSPHESPWMTGVQCEACHGPGARHATHPEDNRMLTEGEKRCLECHNQDNDPDFDFQRKWRQIEH